MDIWFPIAEVSLNLWVIIALGLGVGTASGFFGVGGGFLMTPLLMFIGVPPAIAVGTQASQLVAASFSGYLAQARRNLVDNKMGLMLLIGGIIGSWSGVLLFKHLQAMGHIDAVIAFSYIFFLSLVGGLMLWETASSLRRKHPPVKRHGLWHRIGRILPFKTRFEASKLYISPLLPICLGGLVGVLVSLMGIGGGFLMVPAMIYILGMPANMVSGTSLLQITVVSAMVTVLQVVENNTVDLMLALPLIIGSALGAQIGSRFSTRMRGEHVRILLALTVLAIAIKMLYTLIRTPDTLYSFQVLGY